MIDGGHRLRLTRLNRSLTYRDVEHLSRILFQRCADDRYTVRISVLADIENHGVIPTIFRLCVLFTLLDMPNVIEWFGVRSRAADRSLVEKGLRWIDQIDQHHTDYTVLKR
jgi:hypothetical protein